MTRMSGRPPSTEHQPTLVRDRRALMTVGQLARRSGLSRKAIRELEGRGLIYTAGRSDSNYRLFDESALSCTRTIGALRGLGLTLAQIERLHDHHLANPQQPIDAQLDRTLVTVRARLTTRIGELQETVARIDAYRSSTPRHRPNGPDRDPCLSDSATRGPAAPAPRRSRHG
jgi:DNA-binding transcriptional MerR regulator